MSEKNYDLIVIGAGPGGYVAAIRAAQLGMKVAIVEKEPSLGGTCLRIGCIPSKALLESSEHYAVAKNEFKTHGIELERLSLNLAAMMERKSKIVSDLTQGIHSLIKKNRIDLHKGEGSFHDASTVVVSQNRSEPPRVTGKHILIATGSRSSSLEGVEIDGERVLTSTEALSLEAAPDHLVVIGAGAIGLELGSVWHRLGSQVTVVEFLDRILPGMDSEIAGHAQKIFANQGIKFHLQRKVTGVDKRNDRCLVNLAESSPIPCDRVLVAVGRKPFTKGLSLNKVGIETDNKGRIPVNEHFETNIQGIYAIGDVISGPMLAHKAEEEGVAVAEFLATGIAHVDYNAIPSVVYTQPEIASVGMTEEQARSKSIEFRKGTFPFKANGRARSLGATAGLVKVLADQKTDRILGVHILGPQAGEMINEAAAAMSFGASSEDLGRSCHAHPTLSEALKEAALAVNDRAIHI